MPMNVLLTGGTGYIGSHTAIVLAVSGHQITLYDNLSNSSDSVIEKLTQITGQQFRFIRGDVRDTDLLSHTLDSCGIDTVVHFAGLKAVGESVEKPIDYYANNVQGAISLLQTMKSVHVKTLVFSSSATVYGEPQYLPLDESHPTSATNPYGRSKLHIEEMLSDLAKSDPEWRIACLRYFNPVGAHESGLIGENPSGVPNNLMPYITQVAAGQRAELSVFGDDYPPVVVLVARVLWDKGIGEFVGAANILRKRGLKARFVIVGAPDPENRACIDESTREAWRLEGVVELWGFRSDIPQVLAIASIACLPSYREGLPKSLLEAMAAGLPCVATDVPGCREAVIDGDNGLLIPVKNASSLADAIEVLLRNPELAEKMGQRGRARLVQEFSKEKVNERTLALYQEIIPSK